MITIHDRWAQDMTPDIRASKSTILISSLSLHPPISAKHGDFVALWLALCAAAARGVRIEFLLATPTDQHAATARNLHAAKIARERGIIVHLVNLPGLLHAKTMTVDDRIVWVGSGNWTAAAAHHNHEYYLRDECAAVALKIRSRWHNVGGCRG